MVRNMVLTVRKWPRTLRSRIPIPTTLAMEPTKVTETINKFDVDHGSRWTIKKRVSRLIYPKLSSHICVISQVRYIYCAKSHLEWKTQLLDIFHEHARLLGCKISKCWWDQLTHITQSTLHYPLESISKSQISWYIIFSYKWLYIDISFLPPSLPPCPVSPSLVKMPVSQMSAPCFCHVWERLKTNLT